MRDDAIELSSLHCLKSTFLIKAMSVIYPPPRLHNLEIKSDLSSKIQVKKSGNCRSMSEDFVSSDSSIKSQIASSPSCGDIK